LDMIR